MKLAKLYHKINYHAHHNTFRINVIVLGGDDILTYKTDWVDQEFIDCAYESLEYFLINESGIRINDDDLDYLRERMYYLIEEVICCTFGYALEVWFELDDDDDAQMLEAAQLSFDETSNITPRPVSKLVVESLTRRTYMTKTEKEENNKIDVEGCTICLQEFSNGATVVTLPCAHDFDDECIVKWFEINILCPVCRFELPSE
ncbi:hypothetical protein BRARA_E01491 [Brassica rapa]|uniref:BnaA05g14450D protein n=3 Tax=Brassica TaxID=3705 RepID=A0A078GKR9_BRANA|nr:E3 ubiquitin-protein ligase MPSR1-like [Brassica napus]RID62415.1 hypothetical protein BRARA_E01491 [Brassica rapa]KAH0854022.1 hypothetical protein HID58_092678 [Brassica napus]CAF2097360.1 unnamed protein product [Brassica napus]CAG7875372.1 unnamed protein product [Brassica rapa]CDY25854.1 BnaA05g14450D [Brassica napus]